ncbi:MAG: phasin family protein [Hydrogenophaga sp.]|uniref:phasin family protein n=1 Tax=Hydrogenophaga sp. TaxID=1904254 RepID=UPI002728F5A6|nr:phasin family protein [Hydrogenophaga sp.]MDO9148270.1 phasin family protein [Hydrogenophaga sp.]MDO9606046.1 phasin family protein [Hydrogenophaga sp.]
MNMNNPADQIIAANKANMEAFEAAFKKAFTGAEKLVELNMAAGKAAVSESFTHAKAALSAKTPQEFMTLQTGFFQPMAEKSTAYFQHVQSIAAEGSADITKQIEANMADAQKAFGASVDQLVKSAPTGSETAVAAFQSALSNSQKAIESAQASIKKATEVAQANFAVATKQTTDMVKKAAKAV